jgi:hypothetical protein
MTLADRILDFYRQLRFDPRIPGVRVMNPYSDRVVFALVRMFAEKFYSDDRPRRMILGINPGRFGAGVTGIMFTDPHNLRDGCGIANDLIGKSELSADFFYSAVKGYGGPSAFYGDFYVSAVSPLGFTRSGRNLNYYDNPKLLARVAPFADACIRQQIAFGLRTDVCYCLGEGTNYRHVEAWNRTHGWFDRILALPHPRWIMQYRRKKKSEFVESYVRAFRSADGCL